MKKEYVLIVCMLILLGSFFVGCGTEKQELETEIPNYELLAPMEVPKMTPNESSYLHIEYTELDFENKATIIYGRYGFRYTLETDEKIVLSQEVLANSGLEKVTFGIYEDEALCKPISEIDMDDVLKMNHKFEMGKASREDYPDFMEWNMVVLEPGIYYLAVFSTDPKEDGVVAYECMYGVVESEIALEEGEWGFFFYAGNDHDTYFKIDVERAGNLILRSERQMHYEIWLCDSNKEPIKEVKEDKKRSHKRETHVDEPGTYFLRVKPDVDGPRIWCYELKYELQ